MDLKFLVRFVFVPKDFFETGSHYEKPWLTGNSLYRPG